MNFLNYLSLADVSDLSVSANACAIIGLILQVGILVLGFIYILRNGSKAAKKTVALTIPLFFSDLCFTIPLYMQMEKNGNGVPLGWLFICERTVKCFSFSTSNSELHLADSGFSPLFQILYAIAVLISSLTLILGIVFYLFGLVNFLRRRWFVFAGCDIVLGYGPSAQNYIKNSSSSRILVWIDNKEDKSKIETLQQKHLVYLWNSFSAVKLKRLLLGGGKEYNLIVFSDSGKNIDNVVREFKSFQRISRFKKNLYLHLETESQYSEYVRNNIVGGTQNPEEQEAERMINCFSRHELTARKHLQDTPITHFMPRDFFTDKGTLKEDKQVHIFIFGFGKTGQELLKLSAINNVFLKSCKETDDFVLEPVIYHVYDKKEESFYQRTYRLMRMMENNPKKLSLLSYRLCYDGVVGNQETNELPDQHNLNYADDEKIIHHIAELLKNQNNYVHIYVTMGDDFKDAEFSEFLSLILGHHDNCKIEADISNQANAKDDGYVSHKDISYFGDLSKINCHDTIVDEEMRYFCNTQVNHDRSTSFIRKNTESVPIKTFSNIYKIVNQEFKMNLIGLTIKKEDKNKGLTEAEYVHDILHLNENQFLPTPKETTSKKNKVDVLGHTTKYKNNYYSNYFKCDVANVLSQVEKYKWNMIYLLNGYQCMDLKYVQFVSKKDNHFEFQKTLKKERPEFKEHPCICTYKNLNLYHQMLFFVNIQHNAKMIQEWLTDKDSIMAELKKEIAKDKNITFEDPKEFEKIYFGKINIFDFTNIETYGYDYDSFMPLVSLLKSNGSVIVPLDREDCQMDKRRDDFCIVDVNEEIQKVLVPDDNEIKNICEKILSDKEMTLNWNERNKEDILKLEKYIKDKE